MALCAASYYEVYRIHPWRRSPPFPQGSRGARSQSSRKRNFPGSLSLIYWTLKGLMKQDFFFISGVIWRTLGGRRALRSLQGSPQPGHVLQERSNSRTYSLRNITPLLGTLSVWEWSGVQNPSRMLVDLHPLCSLIPWLAGLAGRLVASTSFGKCGIVSFQMTPPRPAWIMGTGNYPVTIPKALASCISQLEGHFPTRNGRVGLKKRWVVRRDCAEYRGRLERRGEGERRRRRASHPSATTSYAAVLS